MDQSLNDTHQGALQKMAHCLRTCATIILICTSLSNIKVFYQSIVSMQSSGCSTLTSGLVLVFVSLMVLNSVIFLLKYW